MVEISAKDARWRLTEFLNDASFRGTRFLITRNGKPSAVLIGVDDYELLMTRLAEAGADAGDETTANHLPTLKPGDRQ
jgi:prevent-host-death family protein